MNSIIFSRSNFVKELTSFLHRDINFTQVCGFAARKGTREKRKRKKVKIEIVKTGFIPHNLRDKGKSKGPIITKRSNEIFKSVSTDDVYIRRYYRWTTYDFKDAVECHRQTHHPQIYNKPDALLRAFIELDMTGPKKTKFVETFTRIAKVNHPFDHGESRSVLVFCKNPEGKHDAEVEGAALVADIDVVRKLEKGDLVLPDFDFVLAHPEIMPELARLRTLFKKKFPNLKAGTLGSNIGEMVKKFRTGIQYQAIKDEREHDYGSINANIGTLNMDVEHLEDNFISLLNDINIMRPKRPGPFITRAELKSEPSSESFKVNLAPFLEEEEADSGSESDEEEERALQLKKNNNKKSNHK